MRVAGSGVRRGAKLVGPAVRRDVQCGGARHRSKSLLTLKTNASQKGSPQADRDASRRKQAMRVVKDKTKRAAGVVKFPRLVLGRVDWLAQPMRLRWHKIVSAVRLELFQLCFFAAPV